MDNIRLILNYIHGNFFHISYQIKKILITLGLSPARALSFRWLYSMSCILSCSSISFPLEWRTTCVSNPKLFRCLISKIDDLWLPPNESPTKGNIILLFT